MSAGQRNQRSGRSTDDASLLATTRAIVARRMAARLILLRDHRLYRRLGFVRLGDYVEERLGLSLRTAQELMRTEAALRRLPLAARALESGRITSSHVRLLSRVADESNEEHWVGLASRLPVRAFEQQVASAQRIPAGEVAEGVQEESDQKPLPRLRLAVPAWVALLWRETVTLAGRLVGRRVGAGTCLEILLAESLAGLPSPGAPEESAAVDRKTNEAGAFQEGSSPAGSCGESPCGESAGSVSQGVGPPPSAGAAGTELNELPDPRVLDAELLHLAAERQKIEASLGARLRALADGRAYRMKGHCSLESCAREMFGLSPRQTYYLLALHRTLERLPRLDQAFRSGTLTIKKVLLLGKVASRFTERLWIERARSVTLRRLEEEVAFWLRLRECRPEVWKSLQGGPIPEGIVLVPGHPPRLREDAGLHGSARAAAALLDALEEDEALDPLPDGSCKLVIPVEDSVLLLWREAAERLRASIRPDLSDGDVLALLLHDFWRTWDNRETRKQGRRNPTLERDGWRCTAPGCRSVGTGHLQEHHIVFRSMGGSEDDPGNVTTLCSAHHLGLLHRGWIRCSGAAPDRLRWGLGIDASGEALLLFENDRHVDRGGCIGYPTAN